VESPEEGGVDDRDEDEVVLAGGETRIYPYGGLEGDAIIEDGTPVGGVY